VPLNRMTPIICSEQMHLHNFEQGAQRVDRDETGRGAVELAELRKVYPARVESFHKNKFAKSC
jgi:hypothetical protein